MLKHPRPWAILPGTRRSTSLRAEEVRLPVASFEASLREHLGDELLQAGACDWVDRRPHPEVLGRRRPSLEDAVRASSALQSADGRSSPHRRDHRRWADRGRDFIAAILLLFAVVGAATATAGAVALLARRSHRQGQGARRVGHRADGRLHRSPSASSACRRAPRRREATPNRDAFSHSARQSRLRGRAGRSSSATGCSASPGCRRRPRPRPPTGSGRCSTPAPARSATSRTGAAIRREARTTARSRCSSASRCRRGPTPSSEALAEQGDAPHSRADLWRPAPEFRRAGRRRPRARCGSPMRRSRWRSAAARRSSLRKPTYSVDGLGYGPMADGRHAVAARRAADDRRRPARADPSRRHPRQCRSRTTPTATASPGKPSMVRDRDDAAS